MTQIDLGDAARTMPRAVFCYENAFSFPPAPQLIVLATALHGTTDELLSVKSIKPDSRSEDPETRSLWKKLQQVSELREKDHRFVIRLIYSLSRARD